MKICVVGTGMMATGITQVFAQNGYEVMQRGRKDPSLEKSLAKIEESLDKQIAKNILTSSEKKDILSRIVQTTNLFECNDADLYIEAVPEEIVTKLEVLRKITDVASETAIVATNTSSISITELAQSIQHPDNFIGMHFFNPVPTMKLVEIICAERTKPEVREKVFKLCESIGKHPINVVEAPGFVVNRMLIPMINEAVSILSNGIATKEDIDSAMKFGAEHPMGPLELADLIGLDVCLEIMDFLYTEFKDPKYRAHHLLKKMVRAKKLGRKTGVGFYNYFE